MVAVIFSGAVQCGDPVLVLNAGFQLPFNTRSQTGFVDRVVSEALSRLGYRLETVRLPAERALKNVNSGIDDGDMLRVKGLEALYPNIIRVPEKLVDLEFTVFSPQPIDLSRGWQSLQGRSVGYINGWKILEQKVPPGIEVTTVSNAKQLFLLLKKTRVELVIYERWGAAPIIKSLGLIQVERQKPALVVKEMYIYLHKKHHKLVPKLAATLKQLKQEGVYQKLSQELLAPWERQK